MAKYILREEALSHPFANGKYDHRNANIDFILGHESYEEWLETLTAFSEQDIVKSVLEKIRAEIDKARFIDKDTRLVKNALASGLEVALQIIDKCRTESENKDGNNN